MWKAVIFLLFAPLVLWAAVSIGGPVHDGVEVQCDLIVPQRIRNIGSRSDGAGMCVMSSIEMAARYQGLEQLRGLRDWCASQPGGAYPSKVKKQLEQFCSEKHIPVPPYYQEEDVSWDTVQRVVDSGRIACITYLGRDGVRYRGTIAHMVCCVHSDSSHVCILDNNGIGADELLWMTPSDASSRFGSNGKGWLFFWLAPPPPPIPFN